MATPIPPSLAQMLQPPQSGNRAAVPPVQPAVPEAPKAGGFASALAAQRAFFQQVTAPKITPATYTAAQIASATQKPAEPAPTATDPTQPPKRPGSYLNIVV